MGGFGNMRAKLLTTALAVGALSLLIALLALFGQGGAQQTQAAGVTVDVGNYWFCNSSFQSSDPNVYCTTTINIGDTITWHRVAGTHDVIECGTNFSKWSNADGDCVNSNWKSPILNASNPDWSHTFDTPGVFYYVCHFHWPNQKGKIIVQAGPTPTLTPAPTSGPTPFPGAVPVLANVAEDPTTVPAPIYPRTTPTTVTVNLVA